MAKPLTAFLFNILILLFFGLTEVRGFQQEKRDRETLMQEEARDYYRKWLDEDVRYIISDAEKEIFLKLTTDEERESFIEQFWRRRDPDLKTAENEFKEEHYRRIAYANEHFTSGKAGWRTDRGKIYIIHGPPDEISESMGGAYTRPMYEGGGDTATYPFQVWRYREIEGVGSDIELEFVDSTLTGDYKLTLSQWEKDAFQNVPGIGLTMAESKGVATKRDRVVMDGGGTYYPMMALRERDLPFRRLERYEGVTRPKKVKYQDLKDIVEVDISYQTLPFRIHQGTFRLNERSCIIPITLEFANKDLTFKLDESGTNRAKIVIYGLVRNMGKEIVKEFEDDVTVGFKPELFERGLLGTSMYQKILVLEAGRRVKLDLVVKDENSGNVGVVTRALLPPDYGTESLQTSTLLLSDTIQKLDVLPEGEEMFVLGDIKIRPKLDHVFPTNRLMGLYLQVYNAGIDQSTLEPSIQVKYRLSYRGKTIFEIVDDQGESIQFFSGSRVVLTKFFSPNQLGPGKYHMMVEIRDKIKNEMAMVGSDFEIIPAPESAQ